MDIGALRTMVTFQAATVEVDAIGNHTNAWADCFTCHATIGGEGGVTSKEREAAGTTVDDFSMTVTVRWCTETAAITPTTHRLKLGKDVYDIVGVDHKGYAAKSLKFLCRKMLRGDGP